MPKQVAIINYQICEPALCENGICKAVMVCPRKLLKQEEPFEMPDPVKATIFNEPFCSFNLSNN